MTKKQIQYAKDLRRQIHALRVKVLGIGKESFYMLMQKWGYSDSLSNHGIKELKAIKALIEGGDPKAAEDTGFDRQGKKMWSIAMDAGWDGEKLQKHFEQKYNKTHWNILTQTEKRAVIAMLQRYAGCIIDED